MQSKSAREVIRVLAKTYDYCALTMLVVLVRKWNEAVVLVDLQNVMCLIFY